MIRLRGETRSVRRWNGPMVCRLVVFCLIANAAASVRAVSADAQPAPVRALTAVRATSAPAIDGRLDDPVWTEAVPLSGFLQRDPVEGKPATEETRVRVAYDDHALASGRRRLQAVFGLHVRPRRSIGRSHPSYTC